MQMSGHHRVFPECVTSEAVDHLLAMGMPISLSLRDREIHEFIPTHHRFPGSSCRHFSAALREPFALRDISQEGCDGASQARHDHLGGPESPASPAATPSNVSRSAGRSLPITGRPSAMASAGFCGVTMRVTS